MNKIYRIKLNNRLNESLMKVFNTLKFGDIVKFKGVSTYHKDKSGLSDSNPDHDELRYVVIRVVVNEHADVLSIEDYSNKVSALLYTSRGDRAKDLKGENDILIPAGSNKAAIKDTLIEPDYVYDFEELTPDNFLRKLGSLTKDQIKELKDTLIKLKIPFTESLSSDKVLKESYSYYDPDDRFRVKVYSDKNDILNGMIQFSGEVLYYNYEYESQNLLIIRDNNDDDATSIILDDYKNIIEYNDLNLSQAYVDYLCELFIDFLVDYDRYVADNNKYEGV